MARLALAAWLVGAPLAAGCASPAAAPRPAAPRAAPAPIESDLAGPVGVFASKRFGLRLPLPDGDRFRIDDRSEPWLVATHAPSSSSIVVRLWREGAPMTPARCEERARSWRALPSGADAVVVEQRTVEAPRGFDTRVVTAVAAPARGEPLRAFVTAFGARQRQCFAFVLETTARGGDASHVIGVRLATGVERSLLHVVIESDLEPEIPREGPR